MNAPPSVPEASVYRLSLYHCFMGELLRTGGKGRITSRELSAELGIKEETVRRDMSFVGSIGRPGAGYESQALYEALTDFLGLSVEYPIVKVGSKMMLEALQVVFPAESYGVKPVAYFSEREEDVGESLRGIPIRHIADLETVGSGLGVDVALVACSPGLVQPVIDLLARAGIMGVLLLTPSIRLVKPDGMEVHHVRMPCDIKSLACKCSRPSARRSS